MLDNLCFKDYNFIVEAGFSLIKLLSVRRSVMDKYMSDWRNNYVRGRNQGA